MTYRQAQAQGWQLRAGEKGTQIQHWIWEEARTRLGKDGNPERDNEGKPIKELVRLSRPKVSLILGSELGLGYDPGQHAGYVDHWVQILTDTLKDTRQRTQKKSAN